MAEREPKDFNHPVRILDLKPNQYCRE